MSHYPKPAFYPLKSIYFYPTESCNLKCRHCWIAPSYAERGSAEYEKQNRGNLTFEEIVSVIEDAIPMGLQNVKITGGEPFLHLDVFKYIGYFRGKGLSVDIETNGTLLDDSTAKELKRLNCQVSVSLDGASPETHDSARGVNGSFEKTIKAIELLLKHGVKTEAIFSLYKKTQPDLTKAMELLNALNARVSFKINILSPIGLGRKIKDDAGDLDVEEILKLNVDIDKHLSRIFSNLDIYLHIPVAFMPLGRIKSDSVAACRIFNIIGLLSDGSVSYCGIGRLEKDLLMGSVRDKKLSDIWANSQKLAEFRKKMPEALEGICAACIHKSQCLGSCVAQTYSLKKDMFAPFAFCDTAYRRGLFPKSRMI